MSDADLFIVFLSGEGVLFLNQTNDPWYRGLRPLSTTLVIDGEYSRPMYGSDEAASPMGCLQRYQYCNSEKKCGNLASSADALTSASPLFHEATSDIWSGGLLESNGTLDATRSRFNMFQLMLVSAFSLYDVLNVLGSSSLLSPQRLASGYMGPLPDNQWQIDATHWFDMRMAALQAAFVNDARGPSDESLLPYMLGPDDKYQQSMCNNQVSNNPA